MSTWFISAEPTRGQALALPSCSLEVPAGSHPPLPSLPPSARWPFGFLTNCHPGSLVSYGSGLAQSLSNKKCLSSCLSWSSPTENQGLGSGVRTGSVAAGDLVCAMGSAAAGCCLPSTARPHADGARPRCGSRA